jgi:hypothetical protein
MTHPELDQPGVGTTSRVDPMYQWARERAQMIQGLYIHLLIFPIVGGGLFVINWLTRGDGGTWWAQWPVLIWGLGLVIHIVVAVLPVFSSSWVDRKAARIMSHH